MSEQERKTIDSEQESYAQLMEIGAKVSSIILILTGIAYFAAILPALVPPSTVPKYWHLKAVEFSEATGSPVGWEWVRFANRGDYSVYIGIACLAAVTAVGFMGLAVGYFRRKDRLYAVIAVLQALTIVLAATGLLTGGH